MKDAQKIGRLAALIGKYAHRWSGNPSARLHGWVLEFDDVKERMQAAGTWDAYCDAHGWDRSVNAGDMLA